MAAVFNESDNLMCLLAAAGERGQQAPRIL